MYRLQFTDEYKISREPSEGCGNRCAWIEVKVALPYWNIGVIIWKSWKRSCCLTVLCWSQQWIPFNVPNVLYLLNTLWMSYMWYRTGYCLTVPWINIIKNFLRCHVGLETVCYVSIRVHLNCHQVRRGEKWPEKVVATLGYNACNFVPW
jgi:hypothetical protein